MRTFQVLSQVLSVEERRAYLDAEFMSILRKYFGADWSKTYTSALEALEALVEIIREQRNHGASRCCSAKEQQTMVQE